MREPEATIREEYSTALAEYLTLKSEGSLVRAAALGRQALSQGLGVLNMAAIHHAGLAAIMHNAPEAEAVKEIVDLAGTFFCEALSPFEMTHRGFKEISASITRVMQFASAVSHELRTPLTSLMSSVGMLAEIRNALPSSAEGRLLANIDTSIQILKARTDDLLDLVGFQSGALSIRPRGVDLPALLAGVVERNARGRMDVDVSLTVSENIPMVNADPSRLEQVVSNLLQNALKYGADGKKIDVRATTRKNAVCIEVQDYGAGVSLWDRASIWQPNYRGSGNRPDIPGLGIGLALCKELVQQHHGTISLESEQGKGSLFRVELPLSRREGKRRAS